MLFQEERQENKSESPGGLGGGLIYFPGAAAGHVGKGEIGLGLPPFQNESRCAFISATYHSSDYDFNGQKIP